MAGAERQLGWEDYLAQPEDGNRHEIVDGEWVVTPPPNIRHQVVLGRLHLILGNLLEGRSDRMVLFAPLAVELGGKSWVEPDILVLALDDGSVELDPQRVIGPPLLALEVLSPSTRRHDLVRKRRLYEREGVREYWVVDPEDESVSVFHRGEDGGFAPPVKTFADAGGTAESRVVEGFVVELAGVFR
jgi:Uma2 family endonuclease